MVARKRISVIRSGLIACAVAAVIVPLVFGTANAAESGVKVARASVVAATPDVSAAYSTPNCKKKAAAYRVRLYSRLYASHGLSAAPLRCGTSKWGYQHFSKRWSKSFEQNLSKTLRYPKFRYMFGATTIYCRYYGTSQAKYYFKVVYSTRDVPGASTGETGVITATWDKKGGTCDSTV
ncbi:MAG: hypothetical protein JWN52_1972 [Actinomycetia bacterium]|nr:hypothetical protein [Actinomycetes bacterium]